MSEDAANPGGLTDAEYEQFFHEKVDISKCPACGSGTFEWGVSLSGRTIPAILGVAEPPRSYVPLSRLPLAFLECTECGYLFLFNRVAIQRWHKARRARSVGSEEIE